jgi:predicted PhzF superfamily epimerase YddE/YHI9
MCGARTFPWPGEKLLQDIAFENNLAETAFVVKKAGNMTCAAV